MDREWLRYLVVFRVFFIVLSSIPFFSHSDWEESGISVSTGFGNQQTQSQSVNSSTSNIFAVLSSTQINEGWGYKLNHNSEYAFSEVSLDSIERYSHNTYLSSRIFLNESANVDFGASVIDQLKTDGLFTSKNLENNTPLYIDLSKGLFAKADLTKDKDFWNMYLGLNYTERNNSYLSGEIISSLEKFFLDSQLEWQITEDTFLTSRIENSIVKQNNLGTDFETVSSYLGFKTKFGASSELSVFLGDSSSSDSKSIFSWQLTHAIDINDYFDVVLSSKRLITETDDERFITSETTNNTVQTNIRYSQFLEVLLNMSISSQRLSDEVTTERALLSGRINFYLSDVWVLAGSVGFDDYSDDRYSYSENNYQIQLVRELL